ncbi:MAG: P-loop NTPase [Eubacterium sp.]|nr:P-loop NTPase [Eubacterium sp.]
MGGFHCPLGAMSPGNEGCIRCGLCSAASKADYAKAADILRAYIREHAPRPGRAEKIAVCGKGGVGKSTVTAVLARAFADLGYKVLVLDTDESNPTLARQLGLPSRKKPLRNMDSRFEQTESLPWIRQDMTFADIPPEYVSAAGNLMLVTAGKIEDPFAGCACALGALAQLLMLNLQLSEGEVVLADVEAGVESFGRGTERGADSVIAVTEPSLDSLEVAEKIKYMAEGLGISRFRVIVNKAPDEETAEFVTDMLTEKDIRYLGWLPLAKDVSLHSLKGTPLSKTDGTYRQLEDMLKLFLDENEMDYPL